MHTHHAWVYMGKNLSCDFWSSENLGCYSTQSHSITIILLFVAKAGAVEVEKQESRVVSTACPGF